MSRKSMTLPLFEKKKHVFHTIDAPQSKTSNDADDVELSLSRKGSIRRTWSDAADKILNKAKAGVGALHISRSHQMNDEERNANPSMRGGTADYTVRGPSSRTSPRGLSHSGLRATVSLNRVLDSAKKVSRRNSLFGSTILSHTSSSSNSPKGPEDFIDSPVSGSPLKRTSSALGQGLRTDKMSSNNSSPLSRRAKDSNEVRRESSSFDNWRRSSDSPWRLNMAKSSPPPSIHLDVQTTNFFDTQLMEAVGFNQADFAAALNAKLRESPSEPCLGRPCGETDPSQPPNRIYLPSRNTTDHWRTSKVRLVHPTLIDKPSETSPSSPSLTTTGSLLDIFQQPTCNSTEVLNAKENCHIPVAVAEPNILMMDKVFEAPRSSFEKARAKISAKGRKGGAGPLTIHKHVAVPPTFLQRIKNQVKESKSPLEGPIDESSASYITPFKEENTCPQDVHCVSRTPSPEKTMDLPLRPKMSEYGRVPRPVSTSPPNKLKLSLPVKRTLQVSDESNDEIMSPLLTQELFVSDSDSDSGPDNTFYALGLNDLVERATRKSSAEEQNLKEVSGEDYIGFEPVSDAALNTLSDLKRLHPYRKELYRSTLTPKSSRKHSERILEQIRLEHEAIGAVFPTEMHGLYPSDEKVHVGYGADSKLSPREVLCQGQRSEGQTSGSFPGDDKNSQQVVQSPGMPSSNEACIMPVCQVCGDSGDHVCGMVSPSRWSSCSTSSLSSVENGDSDPDSIGLLNSRISVGPEEGSTVAGSSTDQTIEAVSLNNDKGICSLQRKNSEPVGLELHRLGNQAAEWLHSLSPESMKRFMAGGAGKIRPVPSIWTGPRVQARHHVFQEANRDRVVNKQPEACEEMSCVQKDDQQMAVVKDEEEAEDFVFHGL